MRTLFPNISLSLSLSLSLPLAGRLGLLRALRPGSASAGARRGALGVARTRCRHVERAAAPCLRPCHQLQRQRPHVRSGERRGRGANAALRHRFRVCAHTIAHARTSAHAHKRARAPTHLLAHTHACTLVRSTARPHARTHARSHAQIRPPLVPQVRPRGQDICSRRAWALR